MGFIEAILPFINQIPPFPAVLQKILTLVEDPESSAQDVVEVIQYDQAITANILMVCNSAYFNFRRPVSSIRDALVKIGFNRLIEITLTRGSAYIFSQASRGCGLEEGELWRHSVACALLSQLLSPTVHRQKSPAEFTGALLHDIGKVVLSRFVRDHFKDINFLVEEKKLSFADAEKEVLGIDHAELGGRISERWKFPPAIVAGIRHHHNPFSLPEHSGLVSLIQLCNLVATRTGFGGGVGGLSPEICGEKMIQYGLSEKDLEKVAARLVEGLARVELIMNIH